MDRTQLIAAARGDRPLDWVIRDVQLVNVFTCEVYPADIGVFADRIAIVGEAGAYSLEAEQEIDGRGRWAVPGFVDAHVHIESSLVTPANFAKAILPFGTTTVIIDPHEISNVLGKDGVRFMLQASKGIPLRVYVSVPSTVPPVPGKETGGAVFTPEDVAEMLDWPRVIAVGEVMDYIGLVQGDPRMVGVVQAGLDAGAVVQGHAPLLLDRDLNAYLASGAQDDHEMILASATEQKVRLGMLPLLRTATAGTSFPEILAILLDKPFLELAFCTDDIVPEDILANGHLNRGIREAISHGVDPAQAIRWATLVGARHYGFSDLGAIAPGYRADFLLLDSLEDVRVGTVFVDGRIVAKDGAMVIAVPEPTVTVPVEGCVHLQPLNEDSFKIVPPEGKGVVEANVLVFTDDIITEIARVQVLIEENELDLDSIAEDGCILSIVPRHGQTHPPSLALMKGLGLKRGAMAGSVSHDCHNIIAAGRTAADMLHAVQELQSMGGGIVLVDRGELLAKIHLPVAGLMSWRSAEEVAVETRRFNRIASDHGISYPDPMWALAFLALAVIPEVRITDLGLIDVGTQEFLPLFP